jgi:hypothetical protein
VQALQRAAREERKRGATRPRETALCMRKRPSTS